MNALENFILILCCVYPIFIFLLVLFIKIIKHPAGKQKSHTEVVAPQAFIEPPQIQNTSKNYVWKNDKDILAAIKNLSPHEFEIFVGDIFQQIGCNVNVTGGFRDGGVDIVATKGGKTHYIQCKKYISRIVSLSDMRDFYGAIVDQIDEGKAYFVTSSVFTHDAERFAKSRPIRLINGWELVKYVKKYDIEIPVRPNLSEVTEKHCKKCNSRMKIVEGKYGIFWGCSNFPVCKSIERVEYYPYHKQLS